MANIDKIKRILENGETIIDIIQENLDKTSGEIKRIIEKETYNSRRTIERNFEKLHKGLYAQNKTLTNYIKQIKVENTYQIKTDIQNAKKTIEVLELIDKYKFCKIKFKDGHISKDSIDIKNINIERIVKAIFLAEVYIYPNLEEENVKNINDIKLSDNLSNYKTIFYNTKEALKIIKNIHLENVYHDEDIETHYKKSIQTISNRPFDKRIHTYSIK